MSKYYDLEKIGGYLERIAIAVEKIAELEQPQEEVKKEEVEELAKEEVKEPHEALKEAKNGEVSEEELKEKLEKDEVDVISAEEALKIIGDTLEKNPKEEEILKHLKEAVIVEPKKAPVKRGDSRHEIRKARINPYRIQKQPKERAYSGFRIKED